VASDNALAPILKADPFIIGQVLSPALGALGLYTVTITPSSVKYCFRILGIMVSNMISQKTQPPERPIKQQIAQPLLSYLSLGARFLGHDGRSDSVIFGTVCHNLAWLTIRF
jgi:hypothetical protein